MFVVIADYLIYEGKVDRAIELLEANVVGTQSEPGAIRFALHQDQDDPRHLAVVEVWKDQSALEAHRETPHFETCIAELPGLIERRTVTPFNPLIFGDPKVSSLGGVA